VAGAGAVLLLLVLLLVLLPSKLLVLLLCVLLLLVVLLLVAIEGFVLDVVPNPCCPALVASCRLRCASITVKTTTACSCLTSCWRLLQRVLHKLRGERGCSCDGSVSSWCCGGDIFCCTSWHSVLHCLQPLCCMLLWRRLVRLGSCGHCLHGVIMLCCHCFHHHRRCCRPVCVCARGTDKAATATYRTRFARTAPSPEDQRPAGQPPQRANVHAPLHDLGAVMLRPQVHALGLLLLVGRFSLCWTLQSVGLCRGRCFCFCCCCCWRWCGHRRVVVLLLRQRLCLRHGLLHHLLLLLVMLCGHMLGLVCWHGYGHLRLAHACCCLHILRIRLDGRHTALESRRVGHVSAVVCTCCCVVLLALTSACGAR
jgi:hypothetical protein